MSSSGKTYKDLPAGIYSAEVRNHNWPGQYLFRAYPSQGDICQEYVSGNLHEVIMIAEAFAKGVRDPKIYSASF